METFSETVEDILFTNREWKLVESYRSLDATGRSHVDTVLSWEAARREELEAGSTVIELSSRSGMRHLTEYFHDASAGRGIFILGNEAASRIAISDSDWDERTDYVIRVNGDSMEPDFRDGDNVMVSQRVELLHGDIGIFVVNGKAYIKEYGETELISRNPDFDNIPVREYDNIVCMGKVIGKLGEDYEIINE
ncbi:MAG: S24 family peptidase [bacterium]|nr:S24 family peptidase [bacterium]